MPDHLELVQQTALGDHRSFNQLYELFKSKVFNTAISYLRNAEEAEEITQDVFVEIFHSSKNFKGDSQVSTWIYRIAINKSLDKLRYRKRKKRFAFVVDLFQPDSSDIKHDIAQFEHPGVMLENKEKAKILFEAIELLAEQQKTAFLLTFVEDLPQKEVADVMKLSVKAVESLLQRAKANLRKELDGIYERRRK
jgi:RNA polymerase sigma-70 factor (ECF subfamily)